MEVLVQSLARRVFGLPFGPSESAWVESHAASIALVGVERPAYLPFLRLVFARGGDLAADPPAALKAMLAAEGMDPAAYRHLGHWRFNVFEEAGPEGADAASVAALATLLLQLEVVGSAPTDFVALVASLGRYRLPAGSRLDLARLPPWFTRALLRHVEEHWEESSSAWTRSEVFAAADWLFDTKPSPDANQQRAGWSWIQARAREHVQARRRAATPAWQIPFGERTIGPRWIVPVRNLAELEAEALAMKNCLCDHELDCGSGLFAVYSIRDALTSDREACFAVECEAPGREWKVVDVAGKGNAEEMRSCGWWPRPSWRWASPLLRAERAGPPPTRG